MTKRSAAGQGVESGAVLILALVVLLVVTLIGLAGMRATVMQERMAGNLRQSHVALQAAEAALQAGLDYIESQMSPPTADSSGSAHVWPACTINAVRTVGDEGACTSLDSVFSNWRGDLTQLSAGASYQDIVGELGDSTNLPGVVAQPRVYIEVRTVPPLDVEKAAQGAGVHYYTVTAVGFSASEAARAIVQSTVAKVFQF